MATASPKVLFANLKQSERLDLYQNHAKKLLEAMPLPQLDLLQSSSLLMKIRCILKSQDMCIALFCSPDTLTKT